jgi:hypothetical protein
MPDVKGLLSRIWSQFHSAGVSNDDQIVEHLAALLMEDYEEPRSVDLQLTVRLNDWPKSRIIGQTSRDSRRKATKS